MKVLAVVAVFILMVLAGLAFRASLIPYLDWEEALRSESMVQVGGVLVRESVSEDESGLRFLLRDAQGQEGWVSYQGPAIGHLGEVETLVAVGRIHQGVLVSSRLVLQCPSKYERSEDEWSTSSTLLQGLPYWAA